MRTMTELSKTFGVSVTMMHNIIKKLEIPARYAPLNHQRIFSETDVAKIENYFGIHQIEEASKHPLVKDPRFLDLNYWEDIVPDIIKAWGV